MDSLRLHSCSPALLSSRVPRALPRPRTPITVTNAVKEIFMPALSSTMTEGKVVSWLKKPGEKISKGESVVVIESDKADMDVESFNEGFLGSIVTAEGGTANVGQPIGFIAETEAELEDAKARGGSNGAAPAPAPAAQAASPAEAPQAAAAPAPAPAATATATAPPPPAPSSPAPPPPPPAAAPVKRSDGRVIATPYAKKLAQQLRVDLASLAGSGPAGRITASDVEAASNGAAGGNGVPASAAAPAAAQVQQAAKPAGSAQPPQGAPPAPTAAPGSVPEGAPTTVSELKGRTEPFTSMQAAIAKNMLQSLKVPEFRVSYTITTGKLDALSKRLKPKGVTMTALLAKAAGTALAKHEVVNAACTPDAQGITYNDRINVAVAVSMPDGGLITPVLKDAHSTDIYQLSRSWSDLVKRSRSKQLKPDEYNSGTFTISNLGMFGADTFDAILPPGTGAILAVGGSKPTVTADEQGRICVLKQMTCNLTCDHRIMSGVAAAEFMQTFKAIIEDPDQLTF